MREQVWCFFLMGFTVVGKQCLGLGSGKDLIFGGAERVDIDHLQVSQASVNPDKP